MYWKEGRREGIMDIGQYHCRILCFAIAWAYTHTIQVNGKGVGIKNGYPDFSGIPLPLWTVWGSDINLDCDQVCVFSSSSTSRAISRLHYHRHTFVIHPMSFRQEIFKQTTSDMNQMKVSPSILLYIYIPFNSTRQTQQNVFPKLNCSFFTTFTNKM